ncbi:MAG: transposase [Anaerolineales bacterium]|nr:transposase [Anaerolineales bacterium]
MFRAHTDHLQTDFLDTVAQFPESKRQRLEDSWASTFYHEVFCRIEESIFAPLYSDEPSRPNAPVNVSAGLEMLKSGFNWSDEELFNHLDFDVQVRYALGIRDIHAEVCTLRTQYNFRRRVSEYMQETGENPFEQVFVQVTDEQLAALGLKAGHQRMDSTQVSSNIRRYSRLQLLVEMVQRVERMLSEEDRPRYADLLAPYRQGSAGQYCYRVKNSDLDSHLQQVGQVIYRLLDELAASYADQAGYQLLQRVFREHFALSTDATATEPARITVKPPEALRADSLQSPDDSEATYREKHGQGYRGYVVHLSETCDPDNTVQLITDVQVAPNTTDDETLLVDTLPELQRRTQVDTLEVDGGYTGPETTNACTKQKVTLNPSAIRGRAPDPTRLGLDAFAWDTTTDHTLRVTCPNSQTANLTPGRKAHRCRATFDATVCAQCSMSEHCPTRLLKRHPQRVLSVDRRQIEVAQLRQRCAHLRQADHHLRPAVESTVRSIKHPFGSKLPVRGQTRVTMVILASALMVNVRRIWRFQSAEQAKQRDQEVDRGQDSFLSLLENLLQWLICAGQSPFRRRSALYQC